MALEEPSGVVCRSSDGSYVLRVGESDVTTLSLELMNAGEDAHDTVISVALQPSDTELHYLGTDSHVCIATQALQRYACDTIRYKMLL